MTARLVRARPNQEMVLEQLRRAGLLVGLYVDGELRYSIDDLQDLSAVSLGEVPPEGDEVQLAFEEVPGQIGLILPGGIRLSRTPLAGPHAAAGPQLRHAIAECGRLGRSGAAGDMAVSIAGGWMLSGASLELVASVERFGENATLWEQWGASDFANSASYMGSKRALLPFVMSSIVDWVGKETLFVDLMTGSGVVAGAASRVWPTAASDAQDFSIALARVQGAGMSLEMARATVDEVIGFANSNLAALRDLLGFLLDEEASMFHSTANPEVAASNYADFVERIPSYPIGGRVGGWDPVAEVRRRQVGDAASAPAILFCSYFGDLYFGLQQAAEIDSLRFGISRLGSEEQRAWALGSLLASVSAVATTYGGHFAQP
jgi:adenine-specific DNA-methyltransferase